MNNKTYMFLGLAARAGKVVSGDDTCERAIKSGKALAVIIATDASENTKKKFLDKCKYRGVKVMMFGCKAQIGKYIGKGQRTVVAILDKNFAERLFQMIDMCVNESGGEADGKN